MRDKDLRRIAEHVLLHMEKPQAEPIRGNKLAWSYIRFARWAIPILAKHGYIEAEEEKKVPG